MAEAPLALGPAHLPASKSVQVACKRLDSMLDRMQLMAEGKVQSQVIGAEQSIATKSPTDSAVDSFEANRVEASNLVYFKPHDGYAKGCPHPPCFEERLATAQGVHKHMELRDGELGGFNKFFVGCSKSYSLRRNR